MSAYVSLIQWVHEFTDKHPVWEEGMIGNRARSMAALYYHKILKK